MYLRTRHFVCCAAVIAAISPCSADAVEGIPGAVGDGIADDTAAINRAIAAGTRVYFPPGIYSYSGPMMLPANTSYRLYGDGPGVSTILFTNAPAGLGNDAGINGSSMGQASLNVEGLTLKANSPNCGTAIFAQFSAPPKQRSVTIHNVQIIGSTTTGESGTYWTNGIRLFQAANPVIDKVEIFGNIHPAPGSPNDATLTGIAWVSSSSYPVTGAHFSNLEIIFCKTALQTSGWVEGLYLSGFEFVLCGRNGAPAVDLNVNASDGLRKPVFHLVNGHVDIIQGGVRLTNIAQTKISHVNFMHGSAAAVAGTQLEFNNCGDAIVSECTFLGAGTTVTEENGIFLTNSHAVRIAGNNFSHMTPTQNGSCIAIVSPSDLVRVTDNLFDPESVTSRYFDNVAPPLTPTYYFGNN